MKLLQQTARNRGIVMGDLFTALVDEHLLEAFIAVLALGDDIQYQVCGCTEPVPWSEAQPVILRSVLAGYWSSAAGLLCCYAGRLGRDLVEEARTALVLH